MISPLLWRIYFDPLLCKLHKGKQGAKARIEWPIEITQGKIEQEEIQIAGLAYADDTALLANSKASMQMLVNTAESFFRLNNIEINGKKTELIVINRKDKLEEKAIMIKEGKEKIIAKKKNEVARYLGVWLMAADLKQTIKKRLGAEIKQMANLLNRKKISIEHIKYINNVVVLPRAEYKLNMVMLSKHECDKLHQPVIRIAKWKAELASTASNTIPLQKVI